MSRKAFESLLPEGNATSSHRLCAVVDDETGARVGYLWFGERESEESRYVVVYEFMIREEHRRRGYGTEALRALEDEVRAMDVDRIMLHVFGHNHAARALYQKVGYLERNVTMVRWVGHGEADNA